MSSKLVVVGGFYRERCRFPRSDDYWGSGGRAAAVTAGLAVETTLVSPVSDTVLGHFKAIAEVFGIRPMPIRSESCYRFTYTHPLSKPSIEPLTAGSDHPLLADRVTADKALAFGMLEGTIEVHANQLVYDPQNPLDPQPFQGPRPSRGAYILNLGELQRLAQTDDAVLGAARVRARYGLEVVVVKLGAQGAIVLDQAGENVVPSYRTQRVKPIGSGDVFSAAFAVYWACQGRSPLESAVLASKAAALFANTGVLPVPDPESGFDFPPLAVCERRANRAGYDVYLAAPFFHTGQLWLMEEANLALRGMGLRTFSPYHDVGLGRAQEVAARDIEGLRASRAVLALVDGQDAGTLYEVGFARALGLPVVALAQATAEEPLKMLVGTGCDVVDDFATAVYSAAWACMT